ncbi:MAG: ATP-binding protein [Bacteroidales bacterium]|nr:ATP-binding protein [Bacteroidales bacterium]MBR6266388.1 ATP-binding protein [Bacteroidales bacterium]
MVMNKDIIKQCIKDKRDEILSLDVVKRPFEFEERANYVFVGLRRVGKSYMLYQRVLQLLGQGVKINNILFVNFEDERLSEITHNDLNLILEAHYEMNGSETKPIIFFDEIQNVEHWDKFVRRLADAKYTVYVTGSNAKMLSSDVATTLGGRFLIYDVYPYTFSEYLNAVSVELSDQWQFSTIEKSKVMAAFETYFKFGGLPEMVQFKNKRSALQSLYQKIYLGDICARNNIRNSKIMGLVIKKLAESVKQPTSYNRIQNIIKSTGNNATVGTVSEYINHAIESWLIMPVENGLAKIGERESVKKYYFIDNGILNLFLFDSDTSLLENLVAVTLCRKYGRENVVYLKSNIEIDFYIEQENTAIQVSYSISDIDTREREINALLQFAKKNKGAKLMIITKDEQDELVIDKHKISVVPVAYWLQTMKSKDMVLIK